MKIDVTHLTPDLKTTVLGALIVATWLGVLWYALRASGQPNERPKTERPEGVISERGALGLQTLGKEWIKVHSPLGRAQYVRAGAVMAIVDIPDQLKVGPGSREAALFIGGHSLQVREKREEVLNLMQKTKTGVDLIEGRDYSPLSERE